jgi:hypothetical protein
MSPLEHYLRYYDTLVEPGYAVLVTGDWGIGKTHQVKSILKQIDDERQNKNGKEYGHIYVSLYGLSNAGEIAAELVARISPSARILGSVTRKVGDATTSMGGLFALGGVFSSLEGPILRRELGSATHRTLVLDDLERCTIPLNILHGIINQYVEHLGFKIVLIAHDARIEANFAGLKEKLIGQTLRAMPQMDDAWEGFVRDIRSADQRTFIGKHDSVIRQAFEQSGVKSLRILRHVLEDIGRLHDAMSETQLANDVACVQLVGWHAEVNAMLRNADLPIRYFDNPYAYILGLEKDDKRTARLNSLCSASYRINLAESGVAELVLVAGTYEPNMIQTTLSASHEFGAREEDPPWKKVWNRRFLSDDEVIAAIVEMERQFMNTEFEEVESFSTYSA